MSRINYKDKRKWSKRTEHASGNQIDTATRMHFEEILEKRGSRAKKNQFL